MTFRDKVAAFTEKAEAEGIPKWNVAPPLYRFLWWTGLEIPPPVFQSGLFVVLFEGMFFALTFFVMFFQFFTLPQAAVCALGTGVMYGLVSWIQRRDIIHQLGAMPTWERYVPGISYY